MNRFPVIITIGAGLLGLLAGDMLAGDQIIKGLIQQDGLENAHTLFEVLGVAVVILAGTYLKNKNSEKTDS